MKATASKPGGRLERGRSSALWCRLRLVALVVGVGVVAVACGSQAPRTAPSLPDSLPPLPPPTSSTVVAATNDLLGPAGAPVEADLVAEFGGLSPDIGVCAALDVLFDLYWAPSDGSDAGRVALQEAMLDEGNVLLEVDDGPFGEAWHLLIVDLVAVENGQEPKVPLTSELYEEMNALAEQQCGYPVIEVMGAMAQQCFTQISDGSGNKVEREPTCHQRPDPRPAMGVGQ